MHMFHTKLDKCAVSFTDKRDIDKFQLQANFGCTSYIVILTTTMNKILFYMTSGWVELALPANRKLDFQIIVNQNGF